MLILLRWYRLTILGERRKKHNDTTIRWLNSSYNRSEWKIHARNCTPWLSIALEWEETREFYRIKKDERKKTLYKYFTHTNDANTPTLRTIIKKNQPFQSLSSQENMKMKMTWKIAAKKYVKIQREKKTFQMNTRESTYHTFICLYIVEVLIAKRAELHSVKC